MKVNYNEEYLIGNVNVVDVCEGKIIPATYVYVKDGKITKIGEYVECDKKIDADGTFMCPGLINLHAHHFSTGKPSKTVQGNGGAKEKVLKLIKTTKIGDKILNLIVKKNILTGLNSGVTTTRGVGDISFSDVKQRDLINSHKYLGPRLIVSGPAIAPVGGHGAGAISNECSKKEEYEKAIDENIAHGVDFIKIMITGGVMDSPNKGEAGVLKMNLDEVKWCCDYAHKHGLKVAAHVESSLGVEVALKGGVDTIEHSAQITDEIASLMKEKRQITVCTISPAYPYAKLGLDVSKCSDVQQYNAGYVSDGIIESAKFAIKEGLPLGLGTDASCPYAFHYGMWRELVYFKNLVFNSNAKALELATIGNARILGLEKEIGSIEVGKDADYIMLKDNPLEDLTTLRDPLLVSKSGILLIPHLKKDKKFEKTLDEVQEI